MSSPIPASLAEAQISSRRAVRTEDNVAERPLHIARYELLAEIARGGMGTVYRARDRTTNEERALKCVRAPGHPHARQMLEAFEREYQVLRGLQHPRIIRVYDYGVVEHGAYYTMELLTGKDLRRCAPVPWREMCQYLRDVATCLSLLHARRLIHRDLSPSNVKVTGDGHCKLLDFGALLEFGYTDSVVGTPPSIAPEVLTLGRLDQRVDLYALGTLAYYCLTGQHAYPARQIAELPAAWAVTPALPSALRPGIPAELDELVMGLLRENPLARPGSAAEVIARLDAIAQLPPEDDAAQRTLALSFFVAPKYVGRKAELERLSAAIRAATQVCGQGLRVVAPAGAGRTRFLDEVAIRAQLAGAAVVRADAGQQRGRYGTVRALASSLFDALPEVSRRHARTHKLALAALENVLESRMGASETSDPSARISERERLQRVQLSAPAGLFQAPATRRDLPVAQRLRPDNTQGIEHWFVDVSREQPLVVLVDNLESADDASLGTLIGLVRAAPDERLLVVLSEQEGSGEARALGFNTLRAASDSMKLGHLSRAETAELLSSLFGEAPRVERLTDWLHEQTTGSPLHCLGVVRDLLNEGVIRLERGAWVLPSTRPDTVLSEALEDSLSRRISALSIDARELAQCLSLQHHDPSLALCRSLVTGRVHTGVGALLDELAAGDVVHRDHDRICFSSAALRQTLLNGMSPQVRRLSHKRLGLALAALADVNDLAQQLEAGLHLIRGGEEMRGADMIAAVTRDSIACNVLVANLHPIGECAEAALKVYRNARRSNRDRLPLLAALAQAGYYEHYRWAEPYGDDALDVAEELSGLRMARRLRPFVGGLLAIGIGFGIAAIGHYTARRSSTRGSFIELLMQMCCTVTALCGLAALTLNADRCDRVAQILAPCAVLPRRVALVGIYEFCEGLQHIAREHQARAFARFSTLAKNFGTPGYYWFLPPKGYKVYDTACHFARGAFALMRAEGSAALESALVLERSGLPLYVMCASQLRYLYHLNRGDLGMAQVHRERVELHAARVGSAWQVEMWEPASLLPLYIATDDVVELSRISHRLAVLAATVPSMWRYRELADLASEIRTAKADIGDRFFAETSSASPRSFIGWSTALGGAALFCNRRGEHARALALCELALASMSDEDHDYVLIFLLVDLQTAAAEAGIGLVDQAVARLDGLIARHTPSKHALALGLLHDARARIALAAGRRAIYSESLQEVVRWLRPTGNPPLLAMCDRLRRMADANAPSLPAPRVEDPDPMSVELTVQS